MSSVRMLLYFVLIQNTFLVANATGFASELSPSEENQLDRLLHHRYDLPPDLRLKLTEGEVVPPFRIVAAESVTPGKPFKKEFRLTMDGQQVLEVVGRLGASSNLDDSSEAALENPTDSPHFGTTKGPVTVVMFADYQCSFCRDAYFLLRDRVRRDDSVHLVFLHHPLSSHDWSRPAARIGVCMYQHDNGLFWKFTDYVFKEQQNVTSENLVTKMSEFLKATDNSGLEPKLKSCVAAPATDRILLRDENTAFQYTVQATPTFFINGFKIVGLGASDGEFLRQLDARSTELRSPR